MKPDTGSTVGIVTRTKDRPLLLDRALRSILGQSFADWRLVIINDGGAAEPVDALVAKRAKALGGRATVIHNSASRGMEAASNIALKALDTDYLVIHDDDDSWEPSFLERAAAYLDSAPATCGGVICHSDRVVETIAGNRVKEVSRAPFNTHVTEVTLAAVASGNLFPPISFLFRRAALQAVGAFREDLPVLGDWEFNLRLLQRFDVGVVPEVLAHWHHRTPKPSTDATGAYASSTVGQSSLHAEYATRLRNELLRRDLEAGRFGVGHLMNLDQTEATRLRADLARVVESLREAEKRELLNLQHVANLERTIGEHVAARSAAAEEVEATRRHAANVEAALRADLDSLSTELAATRTHASNVEAELAAARTVEATSRAEVERLEAELAATRLHAENVAAMLRSEIAAAEANARAIAHHRKQDAIEFEGRLSALQVQLDAVSADAAHAHERLRAVYNSTSWRFARPVRAVAKLARGLKRRLSLFSIRWTRHRMAPAILHQIETAETGFVATGPDPQFALTSDRGRLPGGRVLISFKGRGAGGYPLAPQVYVDEGAGYSSTPVRVPAAANLGPMPLRLPDRPARLRFDPGEEPGPFTLSDVEIVEVGPASFVLWRLWRALGIAVRDPKQGATRAKAVADLLRDGGLQGVRRGLTQGVQSPTPYDDWVRLYDTLSDTDRAEIRRHIEDFAHRPKISVVMPVYNPDPRWLERAIETVQGQLYPDWELCIADDASPNPAVRELLKRMAARDPRIKLALREKNGHISASSNSALALATGDFIALLDHDDELPEHALYHVAAAVNEQPDADILFSDEDKIDEAGRRYDPYFKPDFSPDLVLSQNAVSHLGVYRRSLVEKAGGFRLGYEGSQDLDLLLRCAELTEPTRIRHIPHILYHWRSIPGSTALAGSEKSYAWKAGRQAVADALERRGVKADVGDAAYGAYWRVSYALPATPPRVSLIIPTRDRLTLVRNCVRTILEVTDYPDIEIVIVDNDSVEPETLAWFDEAVADPRIRVVRQPGPFNYSRLNNAAAAVATGSILGLVNNDIEAFEPGWLREMVGHALRPEVGAVGCMLYYGNDHIQHAGIVAGMGGIAGHVHRMLPRGHGGYFGRAAVTQNLSAVTAACLLVRRDVFQEVGGLDEQNLAVAFNDVDFCLRIRERGYLVTWTPHAQLYHLESISRGSDFTPERRPAFEREIAYMERRWRDLLPADPYFNPNLSLSHTDPTPAFPPRVTPPWRRVKAPGTAATGAPTTHKAA